MFLLVSIAVSCVEQATSELNVVEDWSLNLEITDEINSENDGPKDAVRAIKKRLGHKDDRVVMLTLTVCGSSLSDVVLLYEHLFLVVTRHVMGIIVSDANFFVTRYWKHVS